ncbi:MAG: hypothetical protein J0H92_09765 [Sphingobacteriales bacterium]|nr:hypothetical protein [Sphingobacteriales bacterium]OJW30212.1 MAG: hypothetical protein BGO54_01040 [Sphingobacteriales bacterium 46-32]
MQFTLSLRLLALLLLAGIGSASARQSASVSGIDSTGLPGDQFSLQGALAMFQQSSGIEDFEKRINSSSNGVNNLDLNGDGETDYVRVQDRANGDVHVFVLQVPISETESQDIAVIELERTGDTSAVIQIIGDEDIYGENVVIEPDGGSEDAAFLSPAEASLAGGPSYPEYEFGTRRLVVNVWFWPSVRFVYAPAYRPWVSPWYWRHYPGWWRPWRPLTWHAYYPLRARYYRPFVVVHTRRVVRAHSIYAPVRVSSVTVRTRHQASVQNYRVTRRQTTVTGPRGNSATRTTTTVKGPKGKVKTKRTRVRTRH